MCASTPSHQLPGFQDKLKKAKKVYRLNYCPAHSYHIHYWQDPEVVAKGEVYSAPMLLLADLVTFAQVPDVTDERKLEDAIARKEGRMTLDQAAAGYAQYLGEEFARNMKPANWGMQPLSIYSNVDKQWAEPEKK